MIEVAIYRFGRYVTKVENKKEAVRQWLLDNVPYIKGDNVSIPSYMEYDGCVNIAKNCGYSFRKVGDGEMERKNITMARLSGVLSLTTIEQVATDLDCHLVPRGENLVCDCPICGDRMLMCISPKHQVYKCFGCEKTGNLINFVMDVKGTTYDSALKYLKAKYSNK